MKTPHATRTLILLLSAFASGALSLPAQEKLFPRVPGWNLTVDTTVYTPRNLWNLIDGAAETFLSFGFVDLTLGEYVAPDSLDVRVEAYRHASPTLAFGIYASERRPDYQFIEVGMQGYQEKGVLNFLSGEYYLKLTTHGSGERADRALFSIAGTMAQHLNRPRHWPAGLRHLPEEGREANTEGYISQNLLGYSFLGEAFTALYGEETGFLLFVIELPNSARAEEVVAKYRAIVPDATLRKGGIRFADPNNGPVTLVRRNNLLYGLVNPPGDAIEARYISLICKQPE
jgi:hypothetical protein